MESGTATEPGARAGFEPLAGGAVAGCGCVALGIRGGGSAPPARGTGCAGAVATGGAAGAVCVLTGGAAGADEPGGVVVGGFVPTGVPGGTSGGVAAGVLG